MAVSIVLEAGGGVAVIDGADLGLIEQFKWWAKPGRGSTYAYTHIGKGKDKRNVSMHRMLFDLPIGVGIVDHINGDGLDNRRGNLRLATPSENARNARRSGKQRFRGIWPNATGGTVSAYIMANRKRYYLGVFPCERTAAAAYDTAARLLHGQFASLNGEHGHPMTPQLNTLLAVAGKAV